MVMAILFNSSSVLWLFYLCVSVVLMQLYLYIYIYIFFFLDVTQVLCELELTIQRVKVMTTPDGRVLDLFFITDNM